MLKGCHSEEGQVSPGHGGQKQGCHHASQEEASPSSLGVCKREQLWRGPVGAAWGKASLEV